LDKGYCVTTLGCRVNQCESAAIGRRLEERGWQQTAAQEASVCIVNTCAVTRKAAMQSRQAIRRIARANPGARIIVTGCYAQIDPSTLACLEGVDTVAGNAFKHIIPDLAADGNRSRDRETARIIHDDISACRQFAPLPASVKGTRTRALLKIQDGCNSFCTYCIVPYARGPSRSMPQDEVMRNLHSLGKEGVREVVLTGIHLGQYGKDLSETTGLESVLDAARTRGAIERIRLSSIEPTEISETLLAGIANRRTGRGRLCGHLHVPLQSGDDKILKRMRRPYDGALFRKVITRARRLLPDAAIGVDVLAGFPGEDETAFMHTFELLEQLPVSYLHVFPFSPRPGTPAWHFKDKVSTGVIKERCLKLRRLSDAKRRNFYLSLVGKKVEVLIETGRDRRTGLARGLSDNYVQVAISGDLRPAVNTFVTVEITSVTEDLMVMGKPV